MATRPAPFHDRDLRTLSDAGHRCSSGACAFCRRVAASKVEDAEEG